MSLTILNIRTPNAEVGGELRMASMGTFDKVNPFSLRGIVAAGVSDPNF